jgi:hypothetical protein
VREILNNDFDFGVELGLVIECVFYEMEVFFLNLVGEDEVGTRDGNIVVLKGDKLDLGNIKLESVGIE